MPGTNGATFNVLWIDQGVLYVQGAVLDDQDDFSWASANPTALKLGLGSTGVQQTLVMPGAAGNANLLIIDSTSRLVLVENYTSAQPALVPLSGGKYQPAGVHSASVGVATGGLLMLFAKETATNSLWILRQTGTGTGGAPAFASWVNLGNAVDAVACPALMQSDAEIYAVDMQQTVYHFAQTSDRVWASQRLAAPMPSTAPPKNIAATTMHVTTLDGTQAPVGNAIVTITSDQPATLIVNNLSHQVGPGAPAQVQADPTGNLTAGFSTISLISPVFTFTVDNADGSSASRWCHADVVEQKTDEVAIPPCQQSVASRLGNQDPTQPMNSDTLSKAGLISPNYPDKSGAAAGVVSAGQWLQQNPQAGANTLRTDHITTRHWKLDFRHPAGPQFTELSEEEGRNILAAATARREELGDLAGFLGDILNFFKNLLDELEEISAHLVDDVLNLVINGVQFVVQTVREAASALETVFNKIVQGIKELWQAILDVINFLKQLFEWGDILLTHQVIKATINSLMTTLAADADDLETVVKEQFQTLESQVKAVFGKAEQIFQPGQTFNQFANAQGSNPAGGSSSASRRLAGRGAPSLGDGGNSLAAGPVNTGLAQHGPRCNYVNSYAKSHFSGAGAATLSSLVMGNGGAQGIIDLVKDNWTGQSLQTELTKLQGFVTGKISDPNDFFDLVILDFLIAIEDAVLLILDALESIILAIIEAMASALSGLEGALNATIEIPVISWLYKYVLTGTPTDPGDDLSILDVLCLIFAVPATILYKVIFDGKAPFSATPEIHQIIQSGLPWPLVPTQANLRAKVPAPAALQDISPTLVTELGCASAVATFFGTFITMANDGLAFADEPLPGFAQFASWASVIQSIASQAMGAPLTQFAKDAHTWTAADGWTVGLWGGSLVPLAYDTVFTYATGSLARYTDVAGPALDTGNGLALTAIAIVTAIEQAKDPSEYTGWDQANSVMPAIGPIFKFLILTKDTEAEAVALPLLLVIDFIVGVGSTVTAIGDAVEG